MKMSKLTTKSTNGRTTIYLDPKIKKSVQYYALRDDSSLSQIINDKLYEYLEDMSDLAEIERIKDEPTVAFEDVVKELGLDLNEIRRKTEKERRKTAKKT
jgi:hypothetical protein